MKVQRELMFILTYSQRVALDTWPIGKFTIYITASENKIRQVNILPWCSDLEGTRRNLKIKQSWLHFFYLLKRILITFEHLIYRTILVVLCLKVDIIYIDNIVKEGNVIKTCCLEPEPERKSQRITVIARLQLNNL